tara:strand:- start:4323 stop:5321 length:999 start_codon:yes stop_codon:yes gene_type:complete
MKILAASVGHDSSVCFLENGNISFHMEEEKTTYNKKDPFPMYVFKDLRKYIKGEIDYYIITHLNLPKLNPFVELFENDIPYKNGLKIKQKVTLTDHHLMHTACSFYNSGFEEALVFVSDGGGNIIGDYKQQEIESVYIASYPDQFKLIEKLYRTYDHTNTDYSMGLAFQIVCEMLGYQWHDAGKIMGLSAYGKNNKEIEDFFIKINNKWVSNNFYYKGWKERDYEELRNKPFQYKADLAYKIQKQSKERSLDRINDILKKNKLNNFIMTGGYALNCVNNYEYIKAFPNVNFYFDPLSNDGGTSVGAVKYFWHHLTQDKTIRPLESLYLGNNA